MKTKKSLYNYWNNRAINNNKAISGSNDQLLHEFEAKYLFSLIDKKKTNNVLDVGCGNGVFLKSFSKKFKYKKLTGFDFSKNMILECNRMKIKNSNFFELDINKINSIKFENKFDYIISKRSIINLKSTNQQLKAIENISKLLKKGGKYLACESSANALKNINEFRKFNKLAQIKKPWHNHYIDEDSLKKQKIKNFRLIKIHNFTSGYYFTSRVINALYSKLKNKEPKNSDLLSKVGWLINQNLKNDFSQTKVFEFIKL